MMGAAISSSPAWQRWTTGFPFFEQALHSARSELVQRRFPIFEFLMILQNEGMFVG